MSRPMELPVIPDESAGSHVRCWCCIEAIGIYQAVRLRDHPLLYVPCCYECWGAMSAAERLATAQAVFDAEKLRLHREKIERAANEAVESVGLAKDAFGGLIALMQQSLKREFETDDEGGD